MSRIAFVSHSISDADKALVEHVESELNSPGVKLYLAEREFSPTSVSDKLKAAIASSDFVVALLTTSGASSPYVNWELGVAETMAKPIIPLLEEGVEAPSAIHEKDQIRFKRDAFRDAFKRATLYVSRNFPGPAAEPEPDAKYGNSDDDLETGIVIGIVITAVIVLLVWALTRE